MKQENMILEEAKRGLVQTEGEMGKEAAELRGQADAEGIQQTAEAYGRSQEFYEFLRRLEVIKNTLGRNSRLVLSTDSGLFHLLKESGDPPAGSGQYPAASR